MTKCPLLAHRKNTDEWSRLVNACIYLIIDHPHLRHLIGTEDEKWFDAIETIDLHEPDVKPNAGPLIKLLQSDRVPSEVARSMLADLFRRYELTPRVGRTKTAGYKLTPQHIKLQNARVRYRKLRSEKVKPKVALARAAEAADVLPDQLSNYLNGRVRHHLQAEKRIKAMM